ncbi:MAG: RidA family protein [Cryomorphaceae bacterium]|nr:RidA family protein [Cryomorphaceae bacterium]
MIKIIKTKNAPTPIGPYNQAIQANEWLYCSGQVAINPQTGKFISGSVTDEAEQVLKNLQAVLEKAGTNFNRVVKCGIFLTDMNDFVAVNEVYAKYFKDHHPARETVAVKALPAGAKVEISCVALV